MFDKLFKREPAQPEQPAKEEAAEVTTGSVTVRVDAETERDITPELAREKGLAAAADLVRQLVEAEVPPPVRLAIYENALLATVFEAGAHYAMTSFVNMLKRAHAECSCPKCSKTRGETKAGAAKPH